MFKNLTKTQTVILVLLIVLIAILLIPQIQILFNRGAAEYEPWDPDNINVMKNNIDQLNNEANQIKQRKSILTPAISSLDADYSTLKSISLDSNEYANTLNQISLLTIFGNDMLLTNDYDPGDGSNMYKSNKIQTDDIYKTISSSRNNYLGVYNSLLTSLHYQPISSYYQNFVRLQFEFKKPDSTSKDTTRKYIQLQPPVYKEANSKFETSKTALIQIVKSLDSNLTTKTISDQKRSLELTLQLEKVKDEFNKKNFNINQYAVIIGIPFFIIAALLMYWYGLKSSNRNAPNTVGGNSSEDFKIGLSFTLNT